LSQKAVKASAHCSAFLQVISSLVKLALDEDF
jgi:hypothetical protein